jgi:ribosomal protein L29
MGKAHSFKDQSKEELSVLSRDLAQEIFGMRNELKVTRKLDKPHLLRAKKKERARVLTALHQKGEA